MIVSEGKYYLYRHIRMDTNQVFYIGVGSKSRGSTFIQKYIRAYCRYDRRAIWKRIVAKSEYEVEIVMESNNRQYILEKEKEFIKLYGRIDLKTGTLANLTDGGEGGSNKSREQLDKELETRKRTGSYYRNIERLSKFRNGNTYRAKKAYLYSNEGVFFKEFKNMTECAEYVKITRSLVCNYCRNKVLHSRYIFSDTNYGEYFAVDQAKRKKYTWKRKLVKYSRNWEMLELYSTSKEAGKMNGFNYKNLKFVIDRKTKYKNHNWRWIN